MRRHTHEEVFMCLHVGHLIVRTNVSRFTLYTTRTRNVLMYCLHHGIHTHTSTKRFDDTRNAATLYRNRSVTRSHDTSLGRANDKLRCCTLKRRRLLYAYYA